MAKRRNTTATNELAPKPGWKTSEFWLTLLAVMLAAVLSSGLIEDVSVLTKGITLTVQLLAVMGYTAGRTLTKIAGK